jgi:heat shock protein 1/8
MFISTFFIVGFSVMQSDAFTTTAAAFQSCRQSIYMADGLSVGIDLGTTYSLVSVLDEEKQKPRLLRVDGKTTMPSVVTFLADGTSKVGLPALEHGDPLNTFSSVKRLIGRTIADARITRDDKVFGKRLIGIKGDDNESKMCALSCPLLKKDLLPEEISALILQKLLSVASQHYNGSQVTNAVITVPAYFSKAQRLATEKAGQLAGLQKIKLLKEPEAAAMAYGLNKNAPKFVLVFDLGGGTFDVSVLEVGAGLVEVIATSGDGHLGGDDFDQAIVTHILSNETLFTREESIQLRKSTRYMQMLTEVAVNAKISLTTNVITNMTVFDPFRKQDVVLTLSRRRFEVLCKELLSRILRPVREVAIMAGVNLPGDSGQIGLRDDGRDDSVEGDDVVEDDSDDEDGDEGISLQQLRRMQDPSLAEVKAMSVKQKAGKARAKAKKKLMQPAARELKRLQRMSSDTSLSLFPGGQALDDVILVGGATRMPSIIRLVRTITGIDPKRSVNPDEAICLGAGVLAGVLDGKIEGLQVMSSLQATLLRTMLEEKQKGNPMFNQPLPPATPQAVDKEAKESRKEEEESSEELQPRPSSNKKRILLRRLKS